MDTFPDEFAHVTGKNAHEEYEVDVDLTQEDDEPPPEPSRSGLGLFVVFVFDDGRTLQLHVPNAKAIEVGGDSQASKLSYLLVNRDLSVEASGDMILTGAEALIKGGRL